MTPVPVCSREQMVAPLPRKGAGRRAARGEARWLAGASESPHGHLAEQL